MRRIRCTVDDQVYEDDFADRTMLFEVAMSFGAKYTDGRKYDDWQLYSEEGALLDQGSMVWDLASTNVRARRAPGHNG